MGQFKKFMESERTKGKSLQELGSDQYVRIFRACEVNVLKFKPMDYVGVERQGRKFATDHANHQAAVNDEPYHVISALVKSNLVFEAYNPGEYFYDGPEVNGRPVFVAQP